MVKKSQCIVFKMIVPFTIFILLTSICRGGNTSTNSLQVGIGSGYLYGQTLYQIGDYWNYKNGAVDIPFQLSQLKFTMSDPILYFTFEFYNFIPDWDIKISLQKNIPLITGKMFDSDWGYWYLNGNTWADKHTLDIYSQSDSRDDIWLAYIHPIIHCWTWGPIVFQFLFGLEVQYFYFETENLFQTYPSYGQYSNFLSPIYAQNIKTNIVAIRRSFVEFIFPILNNFTINAGPFQFRFGGGTLPGFFSDVDDHILRSKRSTSFGILFGGRGFANIVYEIIPNLTITADCTFDYITGSGDQEQIRYQPTSEGEAGSLGHVGEIIETIKVVGGLIIAYKF